MSNRTKLTKQKLSVLQLNINDEENFQKGKKDVFETLLYSSPQFKQVVSPFHLADFSQVGQVEDKEIDKTLNSKKQSPTIQTQINYLQLGQNSYLYEIKVVTPNTSKSTRSTGYEQSKKKKYWESAKVGSYIQSNILKQDHSNSNKMLVDEQKEIQRDQSKQLKGQREEKLSILDLDDYQNNLDYLELSQDISSYSNDDLFQQEQNFSSFDRIKKKFSVIKGNDLKIDFFQNVNQSDQQQVEFPSNSFQKALSRYSLIQNNDLSNLSKCGNALNQSLSEIKMQSQKYAAQTRQLQKLYQWKKNVILKYGIKNKKSPLQNQNNNLLESEEEEEEDEEEESEFNTNQESNIYSDNHQKQIQGLEEELKQVFCNLLNAEEEKNRIGQEKDTEIQDLKLQIAKNNKELRSQKNHIQQLLNEVNNWQSGRQKSNFEHRFESEQDLQHIILEREQKHQMTDPKQLLKFNQQQIDFLQTNMDEESIKQTSEIASDIFDEFQQGILILEQNAFQLLFEEIINQENLLFREEMIPKNNFNLSFLIEIMKNNNAKIKEILLTKKVLPSLFSLKRETEKSPQSVGSQNKSSQDQLKKKKKIPQLLQRYWSFQELSTQILEQFQEKEAISERNISTFCKDKSFLLLQKVKNNQYSQKIKESMSHEQFNAISNLQSDSDSQQQKLNEKDVDILQLEKEQKGKSQDLSSKIEIDETQKYSLESNNQDTIQIIQEFRKKLELELKEQSAIQKMIQNDLILLKKEKDDLFELVQNLHDEIQSLKNDKIEYEEQAQNQEDEILTLRSENLRYENQLEELRESRTTMQQNHATDYNIIKQENGFLQEQILNFDQKILLQKNQLQDQINYCQQLKEQLQTQDTEKKHIISNLEFTQKQLTYFQNLEQPSIIRILLNELINLRNSMSKEIFDIINQFMNQIHIHIQRKPNPFLIELYKIVLTNLQQQGDHFNEKSEQIYNQLIQQKEQGINSIGKFFSPLFIHLSQMLNYILCLSSETSKELIQKI